jgi:hypothetical protein
VSLNTIPEQRTSLQYAALGSVKLVVEGGRLTIEAAIARMAPLRAATQSPTRQLYSRLAAEYDARPRASRSSSGLTGEVNPI